MQGLGCRLEGSGFRVQGFGFRVKGVGPWVPTTPRPEAALVAAPECVF